MTSPTETDEQRLPGIMRRAAGFCLAAFFVICVVSVVTNRGLFGDGAGFLLMMVAHGTFFTPMHARIFANALTQALPLLLLHLGCRSFEVLGFVYSLGLCAIPLISLLACGVMLRGRALFVFPLLSYLFATLQGYAMIIGESHEMAALFWPMFIILLEPDRMTPARKIALPILAFLALRAYESSFFFFCFLLALLVFNLARTRSRVGVYWPFIGLIFIAGILWALFSIVHPENAGNEGNFLTGIRYIITRDVHLYVLVALFLLCLLGRASPRLDWTWIAAISLTVFAAAMLVFSFFPFALVMQYNHDFRALHLAVPLGLALVAAAIVHTRRLRLIQQSWLWFSLVPMASYCLAVQMCCALQWYGYLQALKIYLAEEGLHERGVVSYQTTPFYRKTMGRQVLSYVSGGWSMPALSIMLADHGQVNLLIHDIDPGVYVPFPVDQPPVLPAGFGVRYDYLTPSQSAR